MSLPLKVTLTRGVSVLTEAGDQEAGVMGEYWRLILSDRSFCGTWTMRLSNMMPLLGGCGGDANRFFLPHFSQHWRIVGEFTKVAVLTAPRLTSVIAD